MSASHSDKEEFQEKTIKYLNANALKEPLTMKAVDVTCGGEDDGAAVEMKAASVCKNWLKCDMVYCWILEFDDDGKEPGHIGIRAC